MISIVAISIAVSIAGITFIYKYIVLPRHLEVLIRKTQQEEIPEFIEGETGFAMNKEVRLAFEVFNRHKNIGQSIFIINGHSHPHIFFPKYFYQPYLDAGNQLIKYDHRGVGESDWMPDWDKSNPYSLEDMASDIVAILNHLKIDQAHIIGFSMGGMIAQCVAINYPEYVLSLNSVMSSGFWTDPKLTTIPLKTYVILAGINALYTSKKVENKRVVKRFLAINNYLKGKGDYIINHKDVLQRILYEIENRKGFNPKVYGQHTRAIVVSGSRYDRLSEIDVPTLIVHGSDDPLIKVQHAMKYSDLIPNAKMVIIKGMGHDLPEAYMQELNQAIFKNLERSSLLVDLS